MDKNIKRILQYMSDNNIEKGKPCIENDFNFSFYQWKYEGMYPSIDKTKKEYGEDLKKKF